VSIDNYREIPHAIGVAGGMSKADAIIGVARVKPNMVLITDESAAKEIIRRLNK